MVRYRRMMWMSSKIRVRRAGERRNEDIENVMLYEEWMIKRKEELQDVIGA